MTRGALGRSRVARPTETVAAGLAPLDPPYALLAIEWMT